MVQTKCVFFHYLDNGDLADDNNDTYTNRYNSQTLCENIANMRITLIYDKLHPSCIIHHVYYCILNCIQVPMPRTVFI